jgi:damage-control phosphatase, subfamily II, stand-alone protein
MDAPPSPTTPPTFPLLADPAGYVPCSEENMHTDVAYREHWSRHMIHHFKMVMQLAVETYGPQVQSRTDACFADFVAQIEHVLAHPAAYQRLDLLFLDALRQDVLLAHGLPDPFEKAKARENDACLPLYPQVVAELDSHTDDREATLLAVEGVFAGNIFDQGVSSTAQLFGQETPDFLAIRDRLDGKRPWLIDHFDALYLQLSAGRPHYRQAMFFCDNAGADLILGVLPFCRLLAQRGTRVLIAANRLPALNDMTIYELKALLPRLQALDPTLDALVRAGQLVPIDSGNAIPLIDLREVSDEVRSHAAATDLVILEGMGRAVEANLYAKLTVDSLKLAMIKDDLVAQRRGGKMFDTICKFDLATA